MFAVEVTTATAVSTIIVGVVGVLTAAYSARQSVVSGKRADTAEHERNLLAARTVNREDFDSVVDGLQKVISERTAAHNDLLAECRSERVAWQARVDKLEAELRKLEAELRRLRGGRR